MSKNYLSETYLVPLLQKLVRHPSEQTDLQEADPRIGIRIGELDLDVITVVHVRRLGKGRGSEDLHRTGRLSILQSQGLCCLLIFLFDSRSAREKKEGGKSKFHA